MVSVASLAPAALDPDYYATVDTSDATTLRATIHALIQNSTRIAYDNGDNWVYLETAAANPSNPSQVLDLYKNQSYVVVTNHSAGQYNREHAWPQSHGFPQGDDVSGGLSYYPRTDMHALFIADSGANSTRSNRYFANVGTPRSAVTTVANNGVGGINGTYPSDSDWYSTSLDQWQTWSDRKGDMARAVFYMDVRYDGTPHPGNNNPEPDLVLTDDDSLIVTITTAQPVAYMGLKSVVIGWSAADPVDAKEIAHMEVVYAAQGNRNPFVDYPEWVTGLFSGDFSTIAPINPQNVTATPSVSSISLTWSPRIESDLAGYNVYRSTVSGGPYTKINASTVSATNYSDDPVATGTTYYYVVRALDTGSNESVNSKQASSTAGTRTGVYQDSFETAPGTSYTITGTTGFGSAADDYYDRFTVGTKPAGLHATTTGIDGTYFIAAEDTNTTPLPSDGIHTVTFNAQSVSAFDSLEINLLISASDAAGYDTAALGNGDYLKVFVSLDGGADTLIGQFTKLGASGSGGAFAQDTNLDGLGDVEIPSYASLQNYALPVTGHPSSIVVKIVTRFESGSEEVVFDNMRITGIPVTPPAGVGDWWFLD